MKPWIGRGVLATVVLTLVQGIAGFLLFRGEPIQPGTIQWSLFSNALTALLASYLARRLDVATALGRVGVVFLVLFGIPVNYLAETFFFDIGVRMPALWRLYVLHLLVAVACAVAVAWRLAVPPISPSHRARRSMTGWSLRIGLGALAYVVVYFTAGATAFPFMADFYAGRSMPSPAYVALIQLFRGLGYVGIALALVRWLPLHRMGTALSVGLTLSILGGVAPLVVPNVYLPTPVRLVHLIEVGVSNFLFGFFVGWLLSVPRRNSMKAESGDTAAA
jgi:hypothetical protein